MAVMIVEVDNKEDRADDDLFLPLFSKSLNGTAPQLRSDIISGGEAYGPVPYGLMAKFLLVARERLPNSQVETDFPGLVVHDPHFCDSLDALCSAIMDTIEKLPAPKLVFLLWDRLMQPSRWPDVDPEDTTPALIKVISSLQRAGVFIHHPGKTHIPQNAEVVCVPILTSAGDLPRNQPFLCVGKHEMWRKMRELFRTLRCDENITGDSYSPVGWRSGDDGNVSDEPSSKEEISRKKTILENRSLDRLGELRSQLLMNTPVDVLCRCGNDVTLANDPDYFTPWAVFIDDRPQDTYVEVFTLNAGAPPYNHHNPKPLCQAIEAALRADDWKSRFGWVPCQMTDTDVFHLHDLLVKRVSKVSVREISGGNPFFRVPDKVKRAIATVRKKLPTLLIETVQGDRQTYYVSRSDYIRVRRGLLRR